jgi:hypothetical protein
MSKNATSKRHTFDRAGCCTDWIQLGFRGLQTSPVGITCAALLFAAFKGVQTRHQANMWPGCMVCQGPMPV